MPRCVGCTCCRKFLQLLIVHRQLLVGEGCRCCITCSTCTQVSMLPQPKCLPHTPIAL